MPWEPSTDEPLICVLYHIPRQGDPIFSMVSIVLYSNLAAVNRGCTNWTGRGGVINTQGWRGGCVRLQDASRVCSPLATTLSQGYLPATPLVTRVSPVGRQNCHLVVPLDSTENAGRVRAWLYSTFTLVVVQLSQYQFRCVKCVSLHT